VQVARNLHMGDYTNLSIQMDVKVDDIVPTTPPTNLPVDPTKVVGLVAKCLQSGDFNSKPCKKLRAMPEKLLKLREECAKAKNRKKDVCKQLNQVPGLPIPTATSGSGPLPGLPGLPRAGFGPSRSWTSSRGPTMGQLMKAYDPALVSLLVPGLVVSR